MRRSVIIGILALASTGVAKTHTVQNGDSLWTISKRYGCSPEDIRDANGLKGNLIHPGKSLKIPRCSGKPSKTTTKSKKKKATKKSSSKKRSRYSSGKKHVVRSGDSLYKLSKRYNVSVSDLKKRNGLSSSRIRAGQVLYISRKYVPRRPLRGQSVGKANHGVLHNGIQLAAQEGLYIRRTHNAWGAKPMITGIQTAVQATRLAFPKIHDISIGDLSSQYGGHLGGHKSHQNGRDADIGFYYYETPRNYPRNFGGPQKFHLSANWKFITSFQLGKGPGSLQYIFLDYDIQEKLYNYARKRLRPASQLKSMFQYPRGKYSRVGLIRHERGHHNHFHIRFRCGAGDPDCIQ